MTFHKNPSPRGLDSAVSNDMNRLDEDVPIKKLKNNKEKMLKN
jgi:hypothetical protein